LIHPARRHDRPGREHSDKENFEMPPAKSKQDPLSGVVKIGIVALVVCVGLWGCARKPSTPTGASERIRVLETRCQKLEQDYRSVAQARDKARKELANLEEENGRLLQAVAQKLALLKERDQLRDQLRAARGEIDGLTRTLAQRTADRDDLRQQLSQRQAERDQLGLRVDRLRKGLQGLLTHDDNPATTAGPTVGSE
jgi:septal ring factor EnvC (AmiA/AmiB activator)